MKPKLSITQAYDAYFGQLVAYLMKRFPRLSKQDAEDLVQDLFVKILKRGTRFIGEITLPSLIHYLRFLTLDSIRKNKAQKRGAAKLISLDAFLEINAPMPTIEDNGMLFRAESLAEVNEMIQLALPVLSNRQRIILDHIRRHLPEELSLGDLEGRLTAGERKILLPKCSAFSSGDERQLILRQLSRSRSELRNCLNSFR